VLDEITVKRDLKGVHALAAPVAIRAVLRAWKRLKADEATDVGNAEKERKKGCV